MLTVISDSLWSALLPIQKRLVEWRRQRGHKLTDEEAIAELINFFDDLFIRLTGAETQDDFRRCAIAALGISMGRKRFEVLR